MVPLRAIAHVLFSSALLSSSVSAQAVCWYPDGTTQAANDFPCDATASASACCGEAAYCLANGLCMENGIVSRGSCTDQTWSDRACAQYCLQYSTFAGLTPCDADGGTWACTIGNGTDCINDLESPANTWDVVLRQSQLAALGTSAPVTLNPTPTATPTATPSSTSALSPTSTGKSTDNGGGRSNTGAIVGGIVGGVVAGLLIGAALVYFLIRRSKTQQTNYYPMAATERRSDKTFETSKGPIEADNDRHWPAEVDATTQRVELPVGSRI